VHYGGERVGLLRLVLPAGDAGLDPVRQTLIETFAERCGPALANAWTYAAMELQALVDATTGLANHRRFKDYLSDLEREAGRRHEPLSVLMVDLDMFKEFNDTFGHLAGDRALRRVGRILSECVGDGGLTARYGGDEFVAVLPATDSHRAGEIAQAVLERFRQALAEGTDGLAPPVGLSIGRATATVSEADYQTLVGRADLAMYLAKRAGGGVRAFEDLGDDHPLRALVGSIMAQLTKVDLSALGEGRLGPRSPRRAHASRRAGPSRTAEVVRTLVVAMRTKDPALYTHCRNVARLCFRMARRLGLNAWETYDVGLAGLLHDIGKICVPDGILQRPGRLSDAEMEVVRRRAVQGADILAAVPTLVSVSLAVRHHHENFDGSGYPAGLAGDDIPLPARIVLAADAFDAMISDRPYRKGRTPAEALRILREGAGQQFDPRVVSTLTTLLAELGMAAPRAATVHAHGAGNTPTAALEASSA
jgi:diguanylate cyclase (GGDEF)-like protein